MRSKWLPFPVLLLAACSSGSTTGNTSDASAEGASTDSRGDAARADDSASGDDGAAAACPASANTGGPCPVEGQQCSSDCTGCICQSGFWYCAGLGCVGGCGGHIGAPPLEGEACGGCCGPSYGETCTFECVGDDAGTVSETCESTGWHVSSPCGASGADGGLDAQTEGG